MSKTELTTEKEEKKAAPAADADATQQPDAEKQATDFRVDSPEKAIKAPHFTHSRTDQETNSTKRSGSTLRINPAENAIKGPQASQGKEVKKKRTWGNVIYDWFVYTSIAWAGVSAFSLVTAREAMHGSNKYFGWLRSMHQGISGAVHKGLKSTIMRSKTDAQIKPWAEGTALYHMLGFGGTSLTGIIKWMEDNRQKNAGHIDHALGTTPPDPETIANEPKQTWKSVLSGRVLAVETGFAAYLAMGPKLVDRISKSWGEYATKGWMKMRPKSNAVKAREWADIMTFDLFFTAVTASIMYTFSRFVARKSEEKQSPEGALMTVDPATPTPLRPRAEIGVDMDGSTYHIHKQASQADTIASGSSENTSQHPRIEPRKKIADKSQPALMTQRLEAEPASPAGLTV